MKLTVSQVERIKVMLGSGDYTHQQIADVFDVSKETISKISGGAIWGFVRGPETKNKAHKALSEGKTEAIKRLWSEGSSADEIAEDLGVNRATVYRYLKKLGLRV